MSKQRKSGRKKTLPPLPKGVVQPTNLRRAIVAWRQSRLTVSVRPQKEKMRAMAPPPAAHVSVAEQLRLRTERLQKCIIECLSRGSGRTEDEIIQRLTGSYPKSEASDMILRMANEGILSARTSNGYIYYYPAGPEEKVLGFFRRHRDEYYFDSQISDILGLGRDKVVSALSFLCRQGMIGYNGPFLHTTCRYIYNS